MHQINLCKSFEKYPLLGFLVADLKHNVFQSIWGIYAGSYSKSTLVVWWHTSDLNPDSHFKTSLKCRCDYGFQFRIFIHLRANTQTIVPGSTYP